MDHMTYNSLMFDKIFGCANTSDAREDIHPADLEDDNRQRWTDLTDDQKIDCVTEYMREYTVRNGAARASLMWEEALKEKKTTKGMIEWLGGYMVRAKSESWCL